MNHAAQPAAYDEWADFYDLTSPDRSAEIEFYRAFAGPDCRSLLDLGCGTGALTIPLAEELRRHRAAPRVVGLDESAAMLDLAARLDPSVEWVRGDMRSPPLEAGFDLLICGFNTLQLLPTEGDLLSVLHSALQLTSTQGRFVFDLYQPNRAYLHGPIAKRIAKSFTVDRRTIDVIETGSYDPASRVLTSDWTFVERGAKGPVPLRTVRSCLRQYFAEDIARLVAGSGWQIVERYGCYDRSAFTAESKKQLVVCAPRG